MPAISQNIKQDWVDAYSGFDTRKVGLGTIEPNIYATQGYQKKKSNKILIGGMNEIVYAGSEHDRMPLIIPMAYEPAYNTLLALNLHYIPQKIRLGLIKVIWETNVSQIKNNQPLQVEYYALKKKIPEVQGITRRYKTVGVSVFAEVPLKEWPEAAKQPSPWEGMYKKLM